VDTPDRDGRIASVGDDRSRLAHHVLPTIGSDLMADVTRERIEAVRDDLDRKIVAGSLSWKTALHCWTLVRSMLHDACSSKRRELRVRANDPALGVEAPKRGEKKSKQYLWPSEFLTLITSSAVPLRWRQLFALAVYTYARAGELEVLTWDDVDLQHGVLHVHCAADRANSHKNKKVTKPTPRARWAGSLGNRARRA
jgi:integrase